jgi:hypothetical protein
LIKYKDIEKYLANMWLTLLGPQAEEFGFSANENERAQVERQNGAPLPEAKTILTFRLDNYDNWRSLRYGTSTVGYGKNGEVYISELRTFRCIVNIMSKELGDAFDAARFVIANLQNNRYNDFVTNNGRLLGIEQIFPMKNLSDLENGTWTERVSFEVQMNFMDTFLVNDPTMFVKKPDTPGELPNSVNISTKLIK